MQIAVLETQVERLLEKQKELTERVRANEKVVAAIGLFGSIALAFIGAGYFAPKGEAFPSAGEMVQKMREHQSEQNQTPAEDSINSAIEDLWEEEDGSNGSTESEELLQLPSDGDSESTGRRYDRCSDRSWIRFIQERTGKNCRS